MRQRRQKKQERSFIAKVLMLIGAVILVNFGLVFIMSFRETYVPYTLKAEKPLDNPNNFKSKYIYDNLNTFYDSDGSIDVAAREMFEDIGIQPYIITVELPIETDSDTMMYDFVEDYIKEHIDDPYGMYIVTTMFPQEYRGEYYNGMHGEVIYGEEAENFMNANVSKIYNAAYRKYYMSFFDYNSPEACVIKGMALTADRVIHPYTSIVGLLFKLGVFSSIIAVIVYKIKERKNKERLDDILDTSIKDLVEEHAEEIRDRYE